MLRHALFVQERLAWQERGFVEAPPSQGRGRKHQERARGPPGRHTGGEGRPAAQQRGRPPQGPAAEGGDPRKPPEAPARTQHRRRARQRRAGGRQGRERRQTSTEHGARAGTTAARRPPARRTDRRHQGGQTAAAAACRLKQMFDKLEQMCYYEGVDGLPTSTPFIACSAPLGATPRGALCVSEGWSSRAAPICLDTCILNSIVDLRK